MCNIFSGYTVTLIYYKENNEPPVHQGTARVWSEVNCTKIWGSIGELSFAFDTCSWQREWDCNSIHLPQIYVVRIVVPRRQLSTTLRRQPPIMLKTTTTNASTILVRIKLLLRCLYLPQWSLLESQWRHIRKLRLRLHRSVLHLPLIPLNTDTAVE